MKYKVGDKVRVKSKEWYDENKDENGYVPVTNYFTKQMSKFCGKIVIIDEVFNSFYRIKNDKDNWCLTDEMFEDGVVGQNGQRKFKCKDEVLFAFKGEYSPIWTYGIVSHETIRFVILCGNIKLDKEQYKVIPFIGNEDLVGREGVAKEEEAILEKGELVYGFDTIEDIEDMDLFFGRFKCIEDTSIFVNNCPYSFCIPFSKFNPDDLEATKKEILMIKDGKLVKAW